MRQRHLNQAGNFARLLVLLAMCFAVLFCSLTTVLGANTPTVTVQNAELKDTIKEYDWGYSYIIEVPKDAKEIKLTIASDLDLSSTAPTVIPQPVNDDPRGFSTQKAAACD